MKRGMPIIPGLSPFPQNSNRSLSPDCFLKA